MMGLFFWLALIASLWPVAVSADSTGLASSGSYYGLSEEEFFNQAMLAYCNELRASQAGKRIHARERLDEFCIMKVALFNKQSSVSLK